MSSSKDFLKQMRESGEKHSAESEFLNVARMIIKFGYSGFLAGHRPSEFFKPIGTHEDSARVSGEVSSRLKELNSKRDAVFAIMFNIPKDTNTSTLVDWDIEQIIFEDQKADSEYNLFFNTLNEGDFPINEWFWGSYKNVPTGEYKNSQGETKKRYTSLPVEKFANEAAARATVDSDSVGNSDTKWSETARAAYPDVVEIEKQADEILDWLEKAGKGVAYNNDPEHFPLPVPNNTPNLKKYIAELYNIETGDIDLLIPF